MSPWITKEHDVEKVLDSSKMVKARKNHRCSQCGVKIAKKEIYRRNIYIIGRVIETHKICQECLEQSHHVKFDTKNKLTFVSQKGLPQQAKPSDCKSRHSNGEVTNRIHPSDVSG